MRGKAALKEFKRLIMYLDEYGFGERGHEEKENREGRWKVTRQKRGGRGMKCG
jgi:hypothetical protein